MLSVPSSRNLAIPALLLLFALVTVRLLSYICDIKASQILENVVLNAVSSDGVLLDDRYVPDLTLEQQYLSVYYQTHPIQSPNPHIRRLFGNSPNAPDPTTDHVRLPETRIFNISMLPASLANDAAAALRDQKFFNPTLVPLPSHSKYPYLLVSRLVTSGLHQESHACFADICSPEPSRQHHMDTRDCTEHDLALLGDHGGMRCVTVPERVNIPPTPARRCTGGWASFPHIPGFHDPRVFWSGRGEPLIEINSGSQYGCVGLWIVDVRSIVPAVNDVLHKKGPTFDKRKAPFDKDVDGREASQRREAIDLSWLGPPLRYKYVTEVTRNPREARNEVEKNWILFFPSEDEVWVQYDLMGSVVKENEQGAEFEMASVLENGLHKARTPDPDISSINVQLNAGGIVPKDSPSGIGVKRRQPTTFMLPSDTLSYYTNHSASLVRTAKVDRLLLSSSVRELSSTITAFSALDSSTPASVTDSTTNTTTATDQSLLSNAPSTGYQRQTVKGGRTIASLSSYAYTTVNLTHLSEPPCFDLFLQDHIHDKLNNTGHWHQGTNSLRLILCTRSQILSRTCLSDTDTTLPSNMPAEKTINLRDYEDALTKAGLVVHLAIVHRKFSNEMKLPMRYERHSVVWEARRPFQMLGSSMHPILFGGEMAHPWSRSENGVRQRTPDTSAQGQEGKVKMLRKSERDGTESKDIRKSEVQEGLVDPDISSSAYFTYTPSLAWAFRSASKIVDAQLNKERGHEDLGTGYLDDEMLVGIGMDDTRQGFARVAVRRMLNDMRLCEDLHHS